jgi:hypothetical protein
VLVCDFRGYCIINTSEHNTRSYFQRPFYIFQLIEQRLSLVDIQLEVDLADLLVVVVDCEGQSQEDPVSAGIPAGHLNILRHTHSIR